MAGYLESRTVSDIRLRRYNVKEKRMVEIIGGDDPEQTLMDCGLKSNEELMVEVKDEEGNFEDFNPNLRYYRIWTWDNYVS